MLPRLVCPQISPSTRLYQTPLRAPGRKLTFPNNSEIPGEVPGSRNSTLQLSAAKGGREGALCHAPGQKGEGPRDFPGKGARGDDGAWGLRRLGEGHWESQAHRHPLLGALAEHKVGPDLGQGARGGVERGGLLGQLRDVPHRDLRDRAWPEESWQGSGEQHGCKRVVWPD